MIGNSLQGKWSTVVAILTATLVCLAAIGIGALAIRYFGSGKHIHGRPLSDLMVEVNDGDTRVRNEARATLKESGADAVPYLIKILENPKTGMEYRIEAVDALRYCGRKSYSATPALINALGDKDVEFKTVILETFTHIPYDPEKLVPALIHLLDDPSPRIRWRAAQNLGRAPAGAEKAIPALRKACDDPDPTVREKAIEVLEKLGITVQPRKTGTSIPPPPPPP